MYGIITESDKQYLELNLTRIIDGFPGSTIRVLEIGICHGETSRGINDYFNSRGVEIEYWGVDSNKDLIVTPPFPDAHVVVGDSSYVFQNVLDRRFHLLFIDGCHCVNHGMLDFLHYSPKVRVGGRVIFHDTAPMAQKVDGYQAHGGDPAYHEFGMAIRTSLHKLGLLDGFRKDWELVEEGWDETSDYGGLSVFKKVLAF